MFIYSEGGAPPFRNLPPKFARAKPALEMASQSKNPDANMRVLNLAANELSLYRRALGVPMKEAAAPGLGRYRSLGRRLASPEATSGMTAVSARVS